MGNIHSVSMKCTCDQGSRAESDLLVTGYCNTLKDRTDLYLCHMHTGMPVPWNNLRLRRSLDCHKLGETEKGKHNSNY